MNIVKTAADGLSRETWTYYVDASSFYGGRKLRVVLSSYEREARSSKQSRKWVRTSAWNASNMRSRGSGGRLEKPPLLPESEVRDELMKLVSIEVHEAPK